MHHPETYRVAHTASSRPTQGWLPTGMFVLLITLFSMLPVPANAQSGSSFIVQVNQGRMTAWTASGQLIAQNVAIRSYDYNEDFLVYVTPNGISSLLNVATASGYKFLINATYTRYVLEENFFLRFSGQNFMSMYTKEGVRRINAAPWARYEHRGPFFVHVKQASQTSPDRGDVYVHSGLRIVSDGTLARIDHSNRLILVFSAYTTGLAPRKIMSVYNDDGVRRASSVSISTYEFIGDSVRYKRPNSSTWVTINP